MRNSTRQLLILDLDETLIFATEDKLERAPDLIVGQYYVYRRPFLDEFLKFCFENFEVAVWTSSTKNYAVEIIDRLLKPGFEIAFLWARERCTVCYDADEQENYLEKKMTKVRRRGYDLTSVIVVDDAPVYWRSSYGNLVRVAPFFGEPADDELKRLIDYLKQLKTVDNIRGIEKRNWRHKF